MKVRKFKMDIEKLKEDLKTYKQVRRGFIKENTRLKLALKRCEDSMKVGPIYVIERNSNFITIKINGELLSIENTTASSRLIELLSYTNGPLLLGLPEEEGEDK